MAIAPAPKIIDPPFYDPPIAGSASDQQHSQAWTDYHQSLADQVNGMVATTRTGVIDGSDAVTGAIGEYMETSGTAVGLSSGATATVATLNLTAGDWDVAGSLSFNAGSGTHTLFGGGLDSISIYNQSSFPANGFTQGMVLPIRRYSASTATAVHLVATATFGGSMTVGGNMRARRVR
jgi:hypothetical protein